MRLRYSTTNIRRLGRHIGRRGAFLMFLTLLDSVLGYSIVQPLPLGLRSEDFYRPFIAVMPLWAWSTCWLGIAALAAIAAVWHRIRPVVFALAACIKTAWAMGYSIGWVEGLPAYSRGYQTAAIFFAFAATVLSTSGWRENDQ
jgi:hypothetical protein